MGRGPSNRKRKADSPLNGWLPHQPFDIPNGKKGLDYLMQVSRYVSAHKHETYKLKNPAGAILKIADLDDTIYKGYDYDVNGWGKFYLPNIVNMQVVAVVEGTSCPCDHLVLMTCEDRKLYAYDGEDLHVVASSLEHLSDQGIEYPASTRYYNGEAFKHMTKDDWAKVRQGAVGKSLDEAHHKLVTANKSRFLENLRSKRHLQGVTS